MLKYLNLIEISFLIRTTVYHHFVTIFCVSRNLKHLIDTHCKTKSIISKQVSILTVFLHGDHATSLIVQTLMICNFEH